MASRREFFKLAGVIATGTALASVAGCSAGQSNSAKAAAGEGEGFLVGYQPVSFAKEARVVIVGAGPAGVLCGYETAKAGLSTIIIDRDNVVGGVARYSAGVQNWFGSEVGKRERGLQNWEEMKESMDAFNKKKNFPELAEKISEYTGKAQDLLADEFGYEWDPVIENYESTWLPKGGLCENSPLFDTIKENLDGIGVEFFFENRVTSLITDANDEVVGVRCVDELTGEITDVKGDYIVLATGGFISDQEMVAKYLPNWTNLGCVITSGNGDGFKLAKTVGIAWDEQAMSLYKNLNGHSEAIFVAQQYGPSLSILQNGRRFMNETSVHAAATGCLACNAGNWWSIWDDTLMNSQNRECILTGGDEIHTCQTIEELAEAMAVPLSELQATFDEYAQICATGEDPKFGRKLWLQELKPPYYCMSNRPVRYKTMGALKTDINCQCLDEKGELVPHMFAAGIMGLFDYSCDQVPAYASGMYVGERIAELAKA